MAIKKLVLFSLNSRNSVLCPPNSKNCFVRLLGLRPSEYIPVRVGLSPLAFLACRPSTSGRGKLRLHSMGSTGLQIVVEKSVMCFSKSQNFI